MNKKGLLGFLLILVVLLVGGFFIFVKNYEGISEDLDFSSISSKYCIAQGHKLELRFENETEVRYCVSSDSQECVEEDFYRGRCSFEGFEKCVPASCCHPSECVLENESPDCSFSMCTMECLEGTMDCGAGYCGFVEGNCEVIWNE